MSYGGKRITSLQLLNVEECAAHHYLEGNEVFRTQFYSVGMLCDMDSNIFIEPISYVVLKEGRLVNSY